MVDPCTQIKSLINFCGGIGPCAFLLGLSRKTVAAFVHKKKHISTIGALLVEQSIYLDVYFSKEQLRPDVTAEKWEFYRRHKAYHAARLAQLTNERSPICRLLTPCVIRANTHEN